MKIFDTKYLDERLMKSLAADDVAHIYNGLDCCVTAEIFNSLKAQLETEPKNVQDTYTMALSKLAPILEMSLRGTRVDGYNLSKTLKELTAKVNDLDKKFQRMMEEIFGQNVNWRSPAQVKTLFYTWLQLKPVRKRNANGIFAPTVNADALESFIKYPHAGLFARFILAMRGYSKSIGFLKSELDSDGRMRCNYNIAGTNTGRLASSMNDFGTGTNLQNVDRSLRYPFIADPGMYMINIDLEQADARNVGAICWETFFDWTEEDLARLMNDKNWGYGSGPEFCGSYLDACESGDLHTLVCRMVWPELDWPDDPAEQKKFCAKKLMHGQDSYRDLSKKLGHGTNYYGTPRTMAKHAHTPVQIINHFQQNYFKTFPVIPAWHGWTINEIQTKATLTTLFGRRRMFFARGRDAATHRKAIAFSPQSMTGEEIDRGMLQLWRHFDPTRLQFLNQVHDSFLFQIPYEEHEELIPQIAELAKVELTLKGGRIFSVPLEIKSGWNWGDYNYDAPEKNPDGLKAWTGKETRTPPSRHSRLKDLL